jgi:hypothetical protein
MKSLPIFAAGLLGLLLGGAALAFPPAPHHTLYGMVRNQFGDPMNVFPCDVYLETAAGTQLRSSVVSGIEPGVNYRLEVPMDSGTSGDTNAYQPTALKPYFPFRLRVQVGATTYLPIEMAGNFSQIGQPGKQTRIDLTLGEDSDGDGLPDAWEWALIQAMGGGLTLADIRPGDDADADGISNYDEYVAGTYAFDPADGFRLTLMSVNASASRAEFLAIRGRTYSLQSSTNFSQWNPVAFRVVSNGLPGVPQNSYLATGVRLLSVEVPFATGAETNRFLRARVQ